MINKEDNMADFFSKSYAIDYDKPDIDYGQGFAIGAFGPYESYIRSISQNGQERSIYIGKNIDTDTWTMIDQTTEFTIGDNPKILVRFTNVVDSTPIKVLWQSEDGENILESYYGIPAPYIKRYDWWSLYLVVFKGPENLQEGKYKVLIISRDKKIKRDLVATIDFSMSEQLYPLTINEEIESIDPAMEPIIDSLIKEHIEKH